MAGLLWWAAVASATVGRVGGEVGYITLPSESSHLRHSRSVANCTAACHAPHCRGCATRVLDNGRRLPSPLAEAACRLAYSDASSRAELAQALQCLYRPLSLAGDLCLSTASDCFGNLNCTACLFGGAADPSAVTQADCESVLRQLAKTCTCDHAAEVALINTLQYCICAFGALSVLCTLSVLLVIFGYSRDLLKINERILAGLMMSNLVYSTANVIPTYMLKSSPPEECGLPVLPIGVLCFARAWWFLGKYGMLSFEIFVLVVSIRALKYGSHSWGRRAEMTSHTVCICAGLAAMVAYMFTCHPIHEPTPYTAFNGSVHISIVSASDDDGNRKDYDAESQVLLKIWAWSLAFMTIGLWGYFKYESITMLRTYRRELKLRQTAIEGTLTIDHLRRSKLRDIRKAGWEEIGRPLEPYIWLFVFFSTPAVVMSTDWCRDNVKNWGYCDVSCEVVLSCRSAATTVIYFTLNKEARGQLFCFRTLLRRCGERISRLVVWCCAGCPSSGKRHRVRFGDKPNIEVHEIPLIEREPSLAPPVAGGVGSGASHNSTSDASEEFTRKGAKAAISGRPLDPENSGSVLRYLELKQRARGDALGVSPGIHTGVVLQDQLAHDKPAKTGRLWTTLSGPIPARSKKSVTTLRRDNKLAQTYDPSDSELGIPYHLMDDAQMPLPHPPQGGS